jgi:hypothetical protein
MTHTKTETTTMWFTAEERAGFQLQVDGKSWLLDDEIWAELWEIPNSVSPTGLHFIASWES